MPLMVLLFLLLVPAAQAAEDPLGEALAAARRGDYAAALEGLRPLAQAGDAAAQYNLGYLYDKGLGVAADAEAALGWYLKAAEQGLAEAQYAVGRAFDEGRGVVRDLARAAKWYRRAAEHGLAAAQYDLATLYANGEGVERNLLRAYAWFHLAAAQGLRPALEQRRRIREMLDEEHRRAAEKLARTYFQRFLAPHHRAPRPPASGGDGARPSP